MAEFTAKDVQALRQKSGAGMMDAKRALQENDGDFESAAKWLREKGLAAAEKKAGRVAAEGLVEAYIHAGGRIGVLVEVNCETDFVAKTEEFRSFVRDIAMQIAAMKAQYLTRDEVPADVVESERSIAEQKTREEGKPEQAIAKIVEGRLGGFYKEIVLLEQESVTESKKSVKAVLDAAGTTVKRFARFEVGA